MRWPTAIETSLAIYAAIATFFWIFFCDSFIDRANMMNDLTGKLAAYEMRNGCLGQEIDRFFWIGECSSAHGQ